MPLKLKSKPGPIPQEALDFFEDKDLAPKFSHQEVWKEEHNAAFTVAKIMEQDILRDVQDSISKSLKEGTLFNKWAKDISKTLDKSGWSNYNQSTPKLHRLKTIYTTNVRSSRAVGQWQRIQRTKKTRPYLVYGIGPSIRHRPEHLILEGVTRPVDDQFWDFATPPNGFGCLCYITQITRSKYEATPAKKKRLPPMTTTPFKNSRTGKIEVVPATKVKGKVVPLVQPGFNYNPGKQHMRENNLDGISKVSKEARAESLRNLKGLL